MMSTKLIRDEAERVLDAHVDRIEPFTNAWTGDGWGGFVVWVKGRLSPHYFTSKGRHQHEACCYDRWLP